MSEKEKEEYKLDVGFRVYKVASSTMKDTYYKPDELKQGNLDQVEDNIKEDRTPEDILTHVLLDLGLMLSLPIERKTLHGNLVFFVNGDELAACFDIAVNFNIILEIAEKKPKRAVFRDACFAKDAEKINVTQVFKRISPRTEIYIL